MTNTQAEFCDSKSDELNLSFMAYIRKLIDEEIRRDKELSQGNSSETTSGLGQVLSCPKVLEGLYTAEQVALLLKAMK